MRELMCAFLLSDGKRIYVCLYPFPLHPFPSLTFLSFLFPSYPFPSLFSLIPLSIMCCPISFPSHSCPFLALNLTPAIPAVGGLLFVFVMSALFHTSFTDPGIIPRATVEEAVYTEKQIGEGHVEIEIDCNILPTGNVE